MGRSRDLRDYAGHPVLCQRCLAPYPHPQHARGGFAREADQRGADGDPRDQVLLLGEAVQRQNPRGSREGAEAGDEDGVDHGGRVRLRHGAGAVHRAAGLLLAVPVGAEEAAVVVGGVLSAVAVQDAADAVHDVSGGDVERGAVPRVDGANRALSEPGRVR